MVSLGTAIVDGKRYRGIALCAAGERTIKFLPLPLPVDIVKEFNTPSHVWMSVNADAYVAETRPLPIERIVSGERFMERWYTLDAEASDISRD